MVSVPRSTMMDLHHIKATFLMVNIMVQAQKSWEIAVTMRGPSLWDHTNKVDKFS